MCGKLAMDSHDLDHDQVDCISGVHLLGKLTFGAPDKTICHVHGPLVVPGSLAASVGYPTLDVYDGLWMHIIGDSTC